MCRVTTLFVAPASQRDPPGWVNQPKQSPFTTVVRAPA